MTRLAQMIGWQIVIFILSFTLLLSFAVYCRTIHASIRQAILHFFLYTAVCAIVIFLHLHVMLNPDFGLLRHGGLAYGYLLILSSMGLIWLVCIGFIIIRRRVKKK